jgi:hypothetical protein
MQTTFGQVQERAPVRRGADMVVPTTPGAIKEIPYDYVATFTLEGKRGNRVPQVINISTDGAFVAVAVGYSFIPGLKVKNRFEFPQAGVLERANTLLPISPNLLFLFVEIPDPSKDSPEEIERKRRETEQLIATPIRSSLAKLCGIHFKYSITDSGSGRELQNLAIHNIAGLGEPSGERPFRPMAKPMLFMPRSTIRIEIEEISEGPLYAKAELFLVLHGYKMLGYGTG